MVGVTDALVQGNSSFRKFAFVFLRKVVRMMRRNRKKSGVKGFFHFIHPMSKILHKWLVPDAPNAIKIGFVTVFIATEIFLKTCNPGECVKSHRSVGRPVKKGRLITLHRKQTGQTVNRVSRSFGNNIRHYQCRNAGCYRRDGVNRFTSVGKSIAENEALADQRIQKRCVAPIARVIELWVE